MKNTTKAFLRVVCIVFLGITIEMVPTYSFAVVTNAPDSNYASTDDFFLYVCRAGSTEAMTLGSHQACQGKNKENLTLGRVRVAWCARSNPDSYACCISSTTGYWYGVGGQCSPGD